MAINLESNNSASSPPSSGAELLTAALAKSQQEIEGEMALQLIQSASVINVPAPVGNIGTQINIKV